MKSVGQRHVWKQETGRLTFSLSDDLYRRELVNVATDVRLPDGWQAAFTQRQYSRPPLPDLQSKAAEVLPGQPEPIHIQARCSGSLISCLPVVILGALCCCCCV